MKKGDQILDGGGRGDSLDGRLVRRLDAGQTAWRVLSGSVDIFALRFSDKVRRFLFTVPTNQILLSWGSYDPRLKIIAVGQQGTNLLALEQQKLPIEHSEALQRWVQQVWRLISKPKPSADDAFLLPVDRPYRMNEQRRAVVPESGYWLEIRQGELQLESLTLTGPTAMPVYPGCELFVKNVCDFTIYQTENIKIQNEIPNALGQLHQTALSAMVHRFDHEVQQQVRDFDLALDYELKQLEGAYENLRLVTPHRHPSEKAAASGSHPLLRAIQLVTQFQGFPFEVVGKPSLDDDVPMLARSAGIRTRQVRLEGTWWKNDLGPLLGWKSETNEPVALLPHRPGAYEIHDPATSPDRVKPDRVSASNASLLSSKAFIFYRPLPGPLPTFSKFWRFCLHGMGRDLFTFFVTGLAAVLLGFLLPFGAERFVNGVVGKADAHLLWQISGGLAIAGVMAFGLEIIRGLALLRIQGRVEQSLVGGIWDRLFRLPMHFSNGFQAGDLADRALAGRDAEQLWSRLRVTVIFHGIFSLSLFSMMFFYRSFLAMWAIPLVMVPSLVGLVLGRWQLSSLRRQATAKGRLESLMVEVVLGMATIRALAVENLVFARWARSFRKKKRADIRVQSLRDVQQSFLAGWTIFSVGLLFFLAVSPSTQPLGGPSVSHGELIGFFVAFLIMMLAVQSLIAELTQSLHVEPTVERLAPLLMEEVEVQPNARNPGRLRGAIDIKNVYFQYQDHGPPILRDVSFEIHPGELVALVGESGAGKSSLIRLLMGLEKPTSGTILFDDFPLETLDIHEIRRQLGVVLQEGVLTSGTILSNIVGASELGMEEAWHAATLAGLADDIRQWPLQMLTPVSEEGEHFSGGQRQRVLIARALIHRPRILLLDEATGSLDNPTQQRVSQSIAQLAATRLVVAHRLSTIEHADRIVVLDQGRVVQEGRFDELVTSPGKFQEIVQRQLL